jgi:hypothetical protein
MRIIALRERGRDFETAPLPRKREKSVAALRDLRWARRPLAYLPVRYRPNIPQGVSVQTVATSIPVRWSWRC